MQRSESSGPSRLERRAFLKLAGAAGVALVAHPFLATLPAAAQRPPRIRTLSEDLKLSAGDLARGRLDGLVATPHGLGLAPRRGHGSLISPVLTSRRPFTHAGLHWKSGGNGGVSFEVRTASNGPWSGWEPVTQESHVPEGTAETVGALIAADSATRLQFRVTFDPSAGGGLEEATVTFINATDGPVLTETTTAAAPGPALTSGGQVLTRSDWLVDEQPPSDWPRMFVPTKKLVVHHTATSNNYNSLTDAIAEVRAVYHYHAVSLGWGDIGYNALVDEFGNVYEGRGGRSGEAFSADVVAGHASAFNYGASGIAYLGTCTRRGEGGRAGVSLSPAARTTFVDMLAFECDRRHIDPLIASDFLLSNDQWARNHENISGHRDCTPTICPGGLLYDELGALRDAVNQRLAGRRELSVSLTPPQVDTFDVSEAGSLPFAWAGSTSEFDILLEGWRRKINPNGSLSEDLDYLSGFAGLPDARPAWQSTSSTSSTFGSLFDAFGIAPLAGGHYTFHVVNRGANGSFSFRQEHTLLLTGEPGDPGEPPSTEPTVTITSPANGAEFSSGDMITFSGTATDEEDGDLTASVVWTSSLQGEIGTGGSFSAILQDGDHVITASATNSAGKTGSANISVRVIAPPSAGIDLSATGFKERGLQKADLTWTGASGSTIAVYRNNVLVATVPNSDSYLDHINQRGSGTYVYRVEAPDTSQASNEVVVSF